MIRSLVIIGNSHVAALRAGWQRIAKQYPGLSVRFFAANSALFNQLELRDGHFGMHDPDRYEEKHRRFLDKLFRSRTIDLTDTDAVLLVGRALRERDHLRQVALRFSIDGLSEAPDLPPLSQAAWESFADAFIERAVPGPEWRGLERPQVFLLPAPIPCETCPPDDPYYAEWATFAAQDRNNVAFLARYRQRAAARMARDGITLLVPPEQVYAANGLTQNRFGQRAAMLRGKGHVFDENDHHHMGAAYGALVLSDVLRRILKDDRNLPPVPESDPIRDTIVRVRRAGRRILGAVLGGNDFGNRRTARSRQTG